MFLKIKEVSISVVPSKWDEPFGRSSLEAASRGCAIIRSNKGGLDETTNHSIVLNKLTSDELFKQIDILIRNPKKLKLQMDSYTSFNLTNKHSSKLLDEVRINLINKQKNIK